MFETVDLHSHSTASDGTLTPAALIARAQALGVDVLALTDHDSTAGLAEAVHAARGGALRLIAGVELSASWARQCVHVVGLGIDPDNKDLQRGLARFAEQRLERAEAMAERLARIGIDGALEGTRELVGTGVITRTHFARFLAGAGHAHDTGQAMKRYLLRGRPGFVACEWVDIEQAVSWILAAGGVAVLAHPARYGMTATKRRTLFAEFRAAGGLAVEVVSPNQLPEMRQSLAVEARQANLAASLGSDFHEPGQPWRELGRLAPLPDGCTPLWEAWPLIVDPRRAVS